jgi:hypothetical protein
VVATIIRDLGEGFVKIPWILHGLSHGRVHRREEAPDDAGPHVSDTKLQVWWLVCLRNGAHGQCGTSAQAITADGHAHEAMGRVDGRNGPA